MTVIILERAPVGLRGQLTRWMLEVQAGVFVGTLSARVRDKLWDLVNAKLRDGGGVLIYRSQSEQGFAVRTLGKTARQIFDIDGLTLVKRPFWDFPVPKKAKTK